MLPSVHKLLDFYAKYYSQLNKTNKSFDNFVQFLEKLQYNSCTLFHITLLLLLLLV